MFSLPQLGLTVLGLISGPGTCACRGHCQKSQNVELEEGICCEWGMLKMGLGDLAPALVKE